MGSLLVFVALTPMQFEVLLSGIPELGSGGVGCFWLSELSVLFGVGSRLSP